MKQYRWGWIFGCIVSMTAYGAEEVTLPDFLSSLPPQLELHPELHPDLQLKQDLLKSHLALQAFINNTEANKANDLNDLSQSLSELEHDLGNMILQLNAGRKLPQ